MMPRRHAVVQARGALLALLSLSSTAGAYTIVLRGGTTIEVLAEPEFREGRALFLIAGGSLGFLPADMVDREATARANEGRGPVGDLTTWKEVPPPMVPLPPPTPPPGPGARFPGGRSKDSFTQEDLPSRPRRRRPGERVDPAKALAAAEAQKEKLLAQLDRLERALAKVEAEIRDLRVERRPGPAATPPPSPAP
jgi:hypothetical protein